jgi:hypothetical protein
MKKRSVQKHWHSLPLLKRLKHHLPKSLALLVPLLLLLLKSLVLLPLLLLLKSLLLLRLLLLLLLLLPLSLLWVLCRGLELQLLLFQELSQHLVAE